MTKHLIFGGSGFTGRHLAHALIAAGETPVVLDVREPEDHALREYCVAADVTNPDSLAPIALDDDDIVYNLAARQYHEAVPHRGREQFFDAVNAAGARNILEWMEARSGRRLVQFSTDMVYGLPQEVPVTTDHPLRPIGEYGGSKKKAEAVCQEFRTKGFHITIFRPRLIVGPGRIGVLAKLFRLIDRGLPVPLIGDGSNAYQMVSVYDCVSAALAAVGKGVPNDTFNLGSANPPQVRQLLRELIKTAGSRSFLLPTPAFLTQGVLRLLDRSGVSVLYPEQFEIADKTLIVDISKTISQLDWTPRFGDTAMMLAAYEDFHASGRLVAENSSVQA